MDSGSASRFEPLEFRRLLSATGDAPAVLGEFGQAQFVTATLTRTGTLVIKGDEHANRISVVRDGNLIKYGFVLESLDDHRIKFSTGVMHASKVKRVLVEAGGGKDRVFIDNELGKPTTVLGGGGHDVIEGNFGATLIGGAGNDRLSVPDTVTAGAATGRPTGGTIDSTEILVALLSGGDGDDVLIATARDRVIGGRGHDVASRILQSHPAVPPPETGPEEAWGERASGIELFGLFQRLGPDA